MSSRGFTLIELMIVIAIVSVLAAIAIPGYAMFVARARMSEVIVQMTTAKLAVVEAASDRATGITGLTQADTNYFFAPDETPHVASIVIQPNGIVGRHFACDTGVTPAECQFSLTPAQADPSQRISWTCGFAACSARFVPSSCH